DTRPPRFASQAARPSGCGNSDRPPQLSPMPSRTAGPSPLLPLLSSLFLIPNPQSLIPPLRQLRYFRRRDLRQQALHDIFVGLSFGLRLEIGADAVAEHRDGHLADVVDGDAEAAVHGGQGLAALDQELAGAGA